MSDGIWSRLMAGLLVGFFLAAGVVFSVFGVAALATGSSLSALMVDLGRYEGSPLFYVCVILAALLGGSVVTKTAYVFLERSTHHAAPPVSVPEPSGSKT